jgi:predicted Zn finger-like uncharacterized protein
MIITCPECSSRFFVDAAAIPPAGRKVRCSSCSAVWNQLPMPEEPEEAAAELGFEEHEQAQAAQQPEVQQPEVQQPEVQQPEAEQPSVTTPEPEPEPETAKPAPPPKEEPESLLEEGEEEEGEPSPPVIERPGEPRAVAAARGGRRVMPLALWGVFLVLVAAIMVGAYRYRQVLVNRWPETTAIFEAWGGGGVAPPSYSFEIDQKSVHTAMETVNGKSVLVVSGVIRNKSTRQRPVPAIRILLLDEGRVRLQQVDHDVDRPTLGPGETVRFQMRIPSPDSKASQIELKLRYADSKGAAGS